MSDAIVALHGWNSSTRGWNEGAWNSEVALPGATGSVGAVTVTGFANVSVTGVSASSTIGENFTTNNGLSATASLGSFFTTNVGFGTTSTLGSFFTTNIEIYIIIKK